MGGGNRTPCGGEDGEGGGQPEQNGTWTSSGKDRRERHGQQGSGEVTSDASGEASTGSSNNSYIRDFGDTNYGGNVGFLNSAEKNV